MKFILALLLLTHTLFGFSLFEDKEAIKNEKLIYLSSLKNLIIATQKTRGLTNSFKNGNVAAQLLVYGERKEMKREIKYLLIAPKKENTHIHISDLAYKNGKAIANTLMQLNKSAFKTSDSAKVFNDYTQEIDKLLAISLKISTDVFKDEAATNQLSVKIMFKTILPLTENIGKARGMGAGIVARGACQDKEVAKMRSFVKNAKQLTRQLQNDMKSVKNLSKKEKLIIETAAKNIESYLRLIEEKVIAKEDIQLDANTFFTQGTSAISDALAVYDINKKILEQ